MMSLKPRNVDFQETWAKLKETVAGVVSLRAVERRVWNARFSDVYALCVAQPEPLAERLYAETGAFLQEHVQGLLQRVRADAELASCDPRDGLLDRYVAAWREYSQGVAYLNCLYSYLNLQHVKRQRGTDPDVFFLQTAGGADDVRNQEVGEMGLSTWERVMIQPLEEALSARVVAALCAARGEGEGAGGEVLRAAIDSTVAVRARGAGAAGAGAGAGRGAPLELYQRLVLAPYLAAAEAQHARAAAALLAGGDVPHYMRHVLAGLQRERALAERYLPAASREAVRACYERAAVHAHLPALHAEAPRLLAGAAGAAGGAPGGDARGDLRRLSALLRPLDALRPLVEAAHAQAEAEGRALLERPHGKDEVQNHFVHSILALHRKYSELFADVFDGAQPFMSALDKACSAVVNGRASGGGSTSTSSWRAPELLARYCDVLLRRRGDAEAEERLAAAILVFKYVDDKDVFQKHYARALARRLIHQLSASMEQEEAMINRLKAACGYEFTNKLHRMYTDVAVSADLNAKFQAHLREIKAEESGGSGGGSGGGGGGFSVQVLQAGAWPLGGAMAPLAPPPQLERPARQFEAFYRNAFSGRRLAWLHHLCTGELRARIGPLAAPAAPAAPTAPTAAPARLYHITATTAQCAVLLAFQDVDSWAARELRDRLQLQGDAWARQVRPLLDAQLLLARGDALLEGDAPGGDAPEGEDGGDGELLLNLNFSCKRSKIRLTCANPPAQQGAHLKLFIYLYSQQKYTSLQVLRGVQRRGGGRGRGAVRGRPQDVPAGCARAHHEAAQGAAPQRPDPGGGVAGQRLVRAVRRAHQEVHRGAHRQAVPGARARPPRHLLLPGVGGAG